MDLGRESLGFTQKQFVDRLNADGVECSISDISRCENGYIERLLYIGTKAVELADKIAERANGQGQALKPFKRACKRSEYEKRILNILSDGKTHTKTSLSARLDLDDRQVRREIQKVKYYYPILQSPDRVGYWLAKDESDLPSVRRLLAEYESKKRIYSRQERPLIAFIYEQEKRGAK